MCIAEWMTNCLITTHNNELTFQMFFLCVHVINFHEMKIFRHLEQPAWLMPCYIKFGLSISVVLYHVYSVCSIMLFRGMQLPRTICYTLLEHFLISQIIDWGCISIIITITYHFITRARLWAPLSDHADWISCVID